MPPYRELYAKGSLVRVRDRATLDLFVKEWRYHNPLQDSQLEHAGEVAKVASIGVYHGGDVLYSLEGIPGVWHEECLELPT